MLLKKYLYALILLALPGLTMATETCKISGKVAGKGPLVPLPGSTIILQGQNNKFFDASTTGSNGLFLFNQLSPGPYKLTVSVPGYIPQIRRYIRCAVNGNTHLNFQLMPSTVFFD